MKIWPCNPTSKTSIVREENEAALIGWSAESRYIAWRWLATSTVINALFVLSANVLRFFHPLVIYHTVIFVSLKQVPKHTLLNSRISTVTLTFVTFGDFQILDVTILCTILFKFNNENKTEEVTSFCDNDNDWTNFLSVKWVSESLERVSSMPYWSYCYSSALRYTSLTLLYEEYMQYFKKCEFKY